MRRSQCSRLVFAIFLIVGGALLFLGNLGLFPVHDVWAYWPLWIIALGVARIVGAPRRGAGQSVGIVLVVLGSFILCVTLGIFHINTRDDSWPIALLAIGVGTIALIRTLESGRAAKPAVGFPSDPPVSASEAVSDNLIHDAAIFGTVKRKIEAPQFRGGEVNALFGGVELNLRRAQISPTDPSPTLEANAMFGSVKIRVPDEWTVDIRGSAILGTYEDKTVPRPAGAAGTPTLTVTGYSMCGSVELEN